MTITDLIKSNFGSIARWVTNTLVLHKLISGSDAEQTVGYVLGALTLLWTLVENLITKRNKPKDPAKPSGVPPVKLSAFMLLGCLWLGSGCSTVRTDVRVPIYVIATPSITSGMNGADQVTVLNRGKEFFDARASLTKYQALVTVRTNTILINVGYSGLNQEAYGSNVPPAITAAGSAVGNVVKEIITKP